MLDLNKKEKTREPKMGQRKFGLISYDDLVILGEKSEHGLNWIKYAITRKKGDSKHGN